jgi:hypothetical protein
MTLMRKTITLLKLIMPLLPATILIGCGQSAPTTVPTTTASTAPTTKVIIPREAFFEKHPELRARYDEFWETSPEALTEADARKLTFGMIQIHEIQKKYPQYTDLVNDLDVLDKRLLAFRNEGIPMVKEIKKVFDPKTDTLFCYHYEEGTNHGQGYLILRNGDFFRTFWTSGSVKRPDEIP